MSSPKKRQTAAGRHRYTASTSPKITKGAAIGAQDATGNLKKSRSLTSSGEPAEVSGATSKKGKKAVPNRSNSQESQRMSQNQTPPPIRRRTTLSGSKDDGEGGGKGGEGGAKKETREQANASAASNKPNTKAERRALQEAQRKAKAERQIIGSKAGQIAREEKVAKEAGNKSGNDRKEGLGGMDDQKVHHQMSSHLPKTRSHAVSGLQHFSHLPQYERKAKIATLLKDHHPPLCILQLGIQYSEELICGSNARCIAILAAFRKVIQDYTTPEQKELRRDLDAVIKPHINFLSQCRPLSVSMGNAIKYLKLKISQIPPEMTESDAKASLCATIDNYIRVKIELAGKAISEFCGKVINDGDVILVHAFSSTVQGCLIDAHRNGKRFRVIVVDSRPKMEGRECLRQLVEEGIKCSYIFINAVSYIMKEVSKVIVGAHGLLANGYVMSRIGTSLIALVAKSYNVPVLVCCETYKFCDKVMTDAFVTNELGDPNDLVPTFRRQGDILSNWKSMENLQLLNLVYDVTSPDLITMVITQLGNMPCTSVPVVLRISRTFEQM